MTRALARFAIAVVLAAAGAQARAADGWEGFFVPFLGDLRAEAAEAKQAGRKGLLLMFHFEECPACTKMKREVLPRPDVQRYFLERFAPVAIDTRGALEVSGFDGTRMPEKEFARAIGIKGSPTFMLFGPDGTRLATHVGGIYDPAEFILLGEYLSSGAYRAGSFAAYRQSKRKQGT